MASDRRFSKADIDNSITGFSRLDEERNTFISDLASNYAQLEERARLLQADLINEQEARRTWQTKADANEQELRKLRAESESQEVVLVVLDGDGALFLPELIERGNDGGKEAASLLHAFVRERLKQDYKNKNTDRWTVIVHVVLNLHGLASKLVKCGVAGAGKLLAEFGHGWTSRKHFWWTDIGYGKDKADHKVTELVNYYMPLSTCKRMFFGPCSDNGFDTVLSQYKYDEGTKNKLILIATRPAEPSFHELGYPMVKLSNIFRDENLPDRPDRTLQPVSNGSAGSANGVAINGQAVSAGTSESTGSSPTAPSYSGMVRAPVQVTQGPPSGQAQPPTQKEYIIVNIEHERLDRRIPAVDAVAERQFKARTLREGNFCNDYHLNGFCVYGTRCTKNHNSMTNLERLVLKHKSRNLACEDGGYCRSFSCWRGHQCGHHGGPSCTRGNDCWLERFHGMDRKPHSMIFQDMSVQVC